MKKLLNKISTGLFTLATLSPVAAVAANETQDGVPTNLDPITSTGMDLDVASILITVIQWVLGFSAAVAVLFLILGGLQFVTSAGNADRVTKAKQTILYSVLGIIVIVLAFIIVLFINQNLKSAVQ